MSCKRANLSRALWCLLCLLILAGCTATFSPGSAREISKDRLLQISESGKSDHLTYMGSDFNYHYVFDSRPGKERTYKVRVTDLKLANTFSLGEDYYVLLPWVIEGQLMGSKPKDTEKAAPGVEAVEKSPVDADDAVDAEAKSEVDDGQKGTER